MNTEEDTTPKKGRGAPPGNKNALKHGYYSYVRNRPNDRSTSGLIDEITVLRTLVLRLYQQSRDDMPIDELMNVVRVLSLASASLTRLLKAQSNLNISSREYREMLDQALENAISEMSEEEASSEV